VWLTKLRVEDDGFDKSGREIWRGLGPVGFRSKKFGDVIAPPDFRSNYASIPRLPIVFLMAGGRASKEAYMHDLEYTLRRLQREEADDLFLEMLLLNPSIPEGLARTMHKAVRWFGNSSWEDETNIVQDPEIQSLIQSVNRRSVSQPGGNH
jgi:hypothetical protein